MANLKTDLFVLCDYATISREQKLSVIGIFDQFFVSNIPTTWPKMYLVAVLSGEPNSDYQVTLKLTPPKETDQKFPDRELTLTLGGNGRANLVTELVNFPLPVVGAYIVQIVSDTKEVGKLEFRVTKTTATYGGQDLQGKKVVN